MQATDFQPLAKGFTHANLTNIDLNTLSSSISIPLLSQSIGIGAYNNCITGKKEYYLFGGEVLKVDISSRKVEKVPHWFYTSQGATSYHEFIPLPTPLLDTIITVPPNCNASDGKIRVITTPGIDTVGFQVSLDSIHWQSNLVFEHLSVGIYTIFMKNDCGLASQTIILASQNAPDSVAYTAKSPICTSSTGRITLLSPAMDSLSFSLNGGPWQNNPVFDSIQKGHYYIYIKDNDGCINIQSLQLYETTAPTSWNLSIDHPENELCQDETIAITLTVEPPSIVEWWIDSYYRIDSTQQTLEWIPSSLGTYYFQAIITNPWGCITELNQFSKTVLDCTIIPNAFSPNGDNANDSFGMVNYSPQNTNEMRIYNRWGQLVFQSDPSQLQWDGNTSDGQEAPPDVYIYQIQVHRNGKEILQKTGEVTLIR